MGLIKPILTCICIMLSTMAFSQDKGWRGIVPLHSTREDIERLLGHSTKPDGYGELYKLENENVFIEYSSGPCRRNKKGGWNIPRGTVVSVTVYPKTKPQLSDLQLDKARYKKLDDPELPGYAIYTNQEEGITYEVTDKGTVTSASYGPAAKDIHLRCPCG